MSLILANAWECIWTQYCLNQLVDVDDQCGEEISDCSVVTASNFHVDKEIQCQHSRHRLLSTIINYHDKWWQVYSVYAHNISLYEHGSMCLTQLMFGSCIILYPRVWFALAKKVYSGKLTQFYYFVFPPCSSVTVINCKPNALLRK